MREHIKNNLMSFFIIVTLVNIAIFICGIVLAPDEKLGYTAFIVPVIDGLLGVIPGLVMYSKRELTVRQMGFSNVDVSKFLAIVLSVAFVYVGVVVIMYLLDFRTAKKMTDDLKAFQKSNN